MKILSFILLLVVLARVALALRLRWRIRRARLEQEAVRREQEDARRERERQAQWDRAYADASPAVRKFMDGDYMIVRIRAPDGTNLCRYPFSAAADEPSAHTAGAGTPANPDGGPDAASPAHARPPNRTPG